jgi:hypothetical protein
MRQTLAHSLGFGKLSTPVDLPQTRILVNQWPSTFSREPVLDAFNHLIQSADDVLWHAAYRPNARPDQRAPGWDLQLQLYDATRQRGGLASCPALPCVAKR